MTTATDEDVPGFHAKVLLARSGETGELRQECPRHVLNLLDAVSMSQNRTRTALVNEILARYAGEQRHLAMMINRVAGLNPTESEPSGGVSA